VLVALSTAVEEAEEEGTKSVAFSMDGSSRQQVRRNFGGQVCDVKRWTTTKAGGGSGVWRGQWTVDVV